MKFLFNYTFANEDNFTEMNILKERQNIVLAIAGSGSRVIPLFAKKPKNMTCVDISSSQLHLTEMRIQAIRQLTHQEYCVLLGYIRSESKLRKAIFEKLDLSPETKKSLWEYFESLGWNSLLFAGEWEKDLSKTTALFQLLIPDLRQKINSCDNLDQQLNLYYEIKPKIKIIKAILFASSLSYSIRNVFSSNNNHLKMSGIIHMISAFDAHMYKVFSRFLIKESFYYSILFTGQYFSYQAPTPEIDEKMFNLYKVGAKQCDVNYVHNDVLNHINETTNSYDFISLSNVPDYLKKGINKKLLGLLQKVSNTKGTVIYRRSVTKNQISRFVGAQAANKKYEDIISSDKTPYYSVYAYEF